ncbi:hypothetical protein CY35_17G029500 [Sphagnum magellanicum]|nr:hypothetical protein CY35_17G029500 [Sphagnum magellanicum]
MAVRAVIVPSYPMLMLPSLPLQSANVRQRAVRLPRASVGHSRKQRSGMVCASGMAESESAGGSGMVDDNMMILRKRIQSLRAQEKFYDMPAEWMEWERNAYASYRADIGLLLSTIQSQLLTMRPGIALSIVTISLAIFPVASLLFLTALGTQIWTLNCAMLDLIPTSH